MLRSGKEIYEKHKKIKWGRKMKKVKKEWGEEEEMHKKIWLDWIGDQHSKINYFKGKGLMEENKEKKNM